MSDLSSPESIHRLSVTVGDNARLFCAGLIHSNFDQEAAEKALNRVYAKQNLPPPKIIWCEGPLQFTNMPWLMELIRRNSSSFAERVRLIKVLKKATKLQGRSKLGAHCIWTKLRELSDREEFLRFGDSLSQQLNPLIMRDVSTQLSNALDAVLQEKGRKSVQHEVRRHLLQFVDRLKRTWADESIMPFLEAAIYSGSNIKDLDGFGEVWNSYNRLTMLNESWGIWDLYWLFGYQNASAIAAPGLFEAELANTLNDWMVLMKNASAYWLFEHVCFACHYPVSYSRDNASRWHNETGPALVLPDGQEIYFWHGTEIPDFFIKRKRAITPLTIKLQLNATLRSIMMEIYGWERFLRESKAQVIDKDEKGTLYRLDFGSEEPLLAVEVVNSTAEPDGTFKRYMLRVPPDTTTVRQAVAWTFQLSKREYDPEVET